MNSSPPQRVPYLSVCVLSLLAAFSLPGRPAFPASRTEMEEIRALSVLTEEHCRKMDEFVAEQFSEMRAITDVSELSNMVRLLTGLSSSKVQRQEVQAAYSKCYAAALNRSYQELLKNLGTSEKENDRQILLSASVILASIDHPDAIESLLNLLEGNSTSLHYWAIKGLGMPRVRQYLSSEDREIRDLRSRIISRLTQVLQSEERGDFVIPLIVQAAPLTADSVTLWQMCVDERIKQYQDWAVEDESADSQILSSLLGLLSEKTFRTAPEVETAVMRIAVELFSVAFQRYLKGESYLDADQQPLPLLSELSRQYLESLLVETEIQLLKLSQNDRQPRFVRYMQKEKWDELQASYDYLVRMDGDINKTYGIYPAGLQTPNLPVVSDAPEAIIEKAGVLRDIRENLLD